MHFIGIPEEAEKDDEILESVLCEEKWSIYRSAWRAAYDEYRKHNGNPHFITTMEIERELKDIQYKLYDNRRSSADMNSIRRRNLDCCPVCGSPDLPSSLDHYLPRSCFPEFSIFRANLVSSCSSCNTSEKGNIVAGKSPERFVHPYFDDWLIDPLWQVEIIRPLQAATFKPVPLCGLSRSQYTIVSFHLSNVLGDMFHRSTARLWSQFLNILPTHVPERDLEKRRQFLERELSLYKSPGNINSWKAAFLRGILCDEEAMHFLCGLA